MTNAVPKIIIAAGGTGGHVFPGVAIAEEIKALRPGADVMFAGMENGLEAGVIPALGWKLYLFGKRSVSSRRGASWFLNVARFPIDAVKAAALLMREKPSVVIGVGGYGAWPLAVASRLFCRPFVIVEPNAIAGRSNRLMGRRASVVFTAFRNAEIFFPKGRTRLLGNPVRREVLALKDKTRPANAKLTVFVFGGSQGARRLNQAMVAALPHLGAVKENVRFIHQTGKMDDFRAIDNSYKKEGFEAEVFPFTGRIWEFYARTDLIIARSGAITLAEISALGLPAVLVPYPYAADGHQAANADEFGTRGAAVVVEDGAFSGERAAGEIKRFLAEPQRLKDMGARMLAMGRPDAARKIAEECLKIVAT